MFLTRYLKKTEGIVKGKFMTIKRVAEALLAKGKLDGAEIDELMITETD